MSLHIAIQAAPVTHLRDLVELGKPRLSALVIFTAGIGVWIAHASTEWGRTVVFLLATSCLVAAGNTLNCWIERELDGLMKRTRDRPLPAQRIEPRVALASGLFLGALSLTALALATNTLTTALGALALLLYVLVYTPMKRWTPWAVLVGAVPGALPPLMGWAAATGSIAVPGAFVFGILFLWQLPHFVAISLYLKDDFQRAGFRVWSVACGDRSAQRWTFGFTVVLVAFSLLAMPLGVAGPIYQATALLLGAAFLALSAVGLRREVPTTWSRQVFRFSLLYLPILTAVLVLDAL